MSNLLSQASLVMIPSGYKEDVVYSPVPTNGNGDLSFTRASNGSRVNSAGLVEVCPWNIAEQSESFDNVAWVKTTDGQVTITANATTAPNGTTTAEKMIASANAGFHCVAQTQSLVAGVFTISIYAKASEYSFLQIFDSLTTDFANFNLTTGAVATVDQYTATIESVGNGWYRCTATKTNPSGNFVFRYGIVTTGTATRGESFTGNGVNGLFIWGAQLNIGSTAKPYFPTTDRLNVPRLTYQNGGGGCPSLLLEKQSTNVVTYSEQFDNAAWIASTGGTGVVPVVTANNAVSPDGTQNADTVVFNAGSGTTPSDQSAIYQTLTLSAGIYTASFYAKTASGTAEIMVRHAGGGNYTKFTITNQWQRFTSTETSIGGTAFFEFTIRRGLNEPINSTATIQLWGAQVEASSYPTSYIPTTSSSATRVADACSKTGISSLIGQTEGVIFIDFEIQTTNQDMVVMNIYNGSNGIYFYLNHSNELYAYVDNGATQVNIASGVLAQGRYKAAFVYKANDFAFYLNGSLIGVDVSGTVPTCNALRLENYAPSPTYQEKTQVYQAILFPTRLTNAELASLTTI